MKISEQISHEFFTLSKMSDYNFRVFPLKKDIILFIGIKDLQKYLKSINDKIEYLESNPVNNV